ncbi:thioredoxin family protein [Cupriavidus sp. USMAHM13]|uniref:glutaredoxin family protein n=1 Tax=Cupriavidus sp. USMAHM13 TaxID=1389192 RepID=UPI0008A6DA76|nr:glutaredoxin family protein [Cupriavidus sp. USMAHM13]AOZ00329.1 thioredoxin family protein [Cupriavidus sp. USMAHM13]
MTALTLYGRHRCRLCDDMKAALAPLRREFDFTLHEVDVEADPLLESRIGERVPLLVGGAPGAGGEALCRYFLDAVAVRVWLAAHCRDLPY